MKNYNFNETVAQYAALDLDEMMAIDGGSAYGAGHAIGGAIHDFCEGFWDAISGR